MIGNRLKTLVPLVECVGCQSLCLLFDREHIPGFRFLKGFVMKPPIADSVQEKSSSAGSSSVRSALEDYARREGLSLDNVLDRVLDLSDQPTFGGPECLSPLEIAALCTSGELSPARRDHLSDCPDCQTLVATSTPNPDLFETFLSRVRGT
jgi:hypothetical protein